MADIHGSVFIIVGAGIAMISLMVDYANFILFFWAGIVMIVFGAVKLSLRKKSAIGFSGEHPDSDLRLDGQERTYQANTGNQPTAQGQQQRAANPNYPPCPYCGRPTHPNFVFCPFCGSRIR